MIRKSLWAFFFYLYLCLFFFRLYCHVTLFPRIVFDFFLFTNSTKTSLVDVLAVISHSLIITCLPNWKALNKKRWFWKFPHNSEAQNKKIQFTVIYFRKAAGCSHYRNSLCLKDSLWGTPQCRQVKVSMSIRVIMQESTSSIMRIIKMCSINKEGVAKEAWTVCDCGCAYVCLCQLQAIRAPKLISKPPSFYW